MNWIKPWLRRIALVCTVHWSAGVTQTKDGCLWLGTQKGLVRFDGVEYKLLKIDPADECHLAAAGK